MPNETRLSKAELEKMLIDPPKPGELARARRLLREGSPETLVRVRSVQGETGRTPIVKRYSRPDPEAPAQ